MPYLNLDPYPGYTSTQGPSARPGAPGSAGATPGTTVGAPGRSYDPTYGGIPQVPSLPGVQRAAVTGNISNLGDLYNLAGPTNYFNQQQLLGQYAAALPGYASMTSQASENIGSNLKGILPPDVANAIAIKAAERGVNTGAIGSPNANAALLRAMGLTSLDLQNQGQTQLTEAIRRSPIAQPFDISRFFFSPEDQFRAQQGANIYSAAPVPSYAGTAALRAAQAGLGAGRTAGGVQPTGTNVAQSLLGKYTGQQPTGPSGNVYGGVASDVSPSQIYTNWQDWARGIPTSQPAESESDAWASIGVDTGAPPAGTVTTNTQSSYDPYGYYYGGG